MKSLLLALVGLVLFSPAASGRPRLALEMELLEGAMKEQKLVLYTTSDLPQSIQLIHDFFQKYAFLDLEIRPLETETLVAKVENESRSGAAGCDVVTGGGGLLQPLFKQDLLASYHSLEREHISAALTDNVGFWSAYYINPYVLGYNTLMVKAEELPKNYDGLLDPRWRGRQIAIDSTADGLFRGLALVWGEERTVAYLTRLAKQQPIMSSASLSAVDAAQSGRVSLMIARAAVIQGFKNRLRSPIDWIFLDPSVAQAECVAICAQSPHPNAARLFVNFVLSREGQSALADIQQLPVRRDMRAPPDAPGQPQRWFVDRPDPSVYFRGTVKRFREIFGIFDR